MIDRNDLPFPEPLDGSNQPGTNADRPRVVRRCLAIVGPIYEKSKIEVAKLLEECHREGYWVKDYKSFAEYVESEVRLSPRTAQELIRVVRKCCDAGVPTSEINRLGWSKVAVVAQQLTSHNAAELLAEVESKSYAQLQESMRQKKRAAKNLPAKARPAASCRPGAPTESLVMSRSLNEALRLACLHTHDPSLQTNLDFIATKFVELCPTPSRIASGDNLN